MGKADYLGEKLKMNEKLSYGIGEIPNAMVSVLGAFLTLYYTDYIGMLPGVLGTMFFISKLLDGVSDLLAGTIIDHTRTKWGKARPWLLWLSVPTGLSLALIFFIPANGSATTKLIYAFLTYNLYNTVLYTMVGCAKNALMALMTQRKEDRVSLSKYNTLFGLGSTLIACSVTFPFVNAMGGDITAWRIVFIVYGVITTLSLLFAFTNAKEKVVSTEQASNKVEKNIGFKESMKLFFSNKYFVFALFMFLCIQMAGQLNTVSQNYFYIYSMNRKDLISVMSIVALVPMVVGLIVLPNYLLKKVGKKKMLYIGSGTHVITMTLIGVASVLGNVPLIIILTVIKSFAVGATSVPIGILPADAIDYGEYLSNKRIEGMGNAVITFSQKVATGLAAGILGWVLQFTGYVANEVQNRATVVGINVLFCYAPALLYAIVFICYKMFYHYDEEEPMVLAELARRKEEGKCAN